jgi:hypothetical protein
MSRDAFEFVAPAISEGRWETHDPDREQNVFHLLLEVERRLRKQAREESKIDYARRQIFRNAPGIG